MGVPTIEEQIKSLEEQLPLVKGRGSSSKKKRIIREIAELKASLPEKEPEEDLAPTASAPTAPAQEPPESLHLQTKNTLIEDGWIPATVDQVKKYEKEGILCGYDPDRELALVRRK